MVKYIGLSFFLILLIHQSLAQIWPEEGRKLNYTITGFSFPAQHNGNYIIEIAKGEYYSEDSFKKNIIIKNETDNDKKIIELPSFGTSYTWRVIYNVQDMKYSNFYHFSTGSCLNIDTSLFRLRVIKSTEVYKDAHLFLDGSKVMYDMTGNPVWYLPDITDMLKDVNTQVRDMKMTPQGTITCIVANGQNSQIFEISYDGDILWKGPNDGKVSGDTSEHYHHEFTKLTNGHYMVLGTEFLLSKMAVQHDIRIAKATDKEGIKDSVERKVPYGTLIEYDEHGNLIWSWKSSKYFAKSDVQNYTNPETGIHEIEMHDNSFCFNEQENTFFISYKRISRIIKVKYPEGNIINTYGEIFSPGATPKGNGYFCAQHCCKLSDGKLYFFNNYDCAWPRHHPTVIRLGESVPGNNTLKKEWEFECPVAKVKEQIRPDLTIGGSVTELTNRAMLVSECTPFNKIFIVSEEKEILWDAMPEKWNQDENLWEPFAQYRVSFIPEGKNFEKLLNHH